LKQVNGKLAEMGSAPLTEKEFSDINRRMTIVDRPTSGKIK